MSDLAVFDTWIIVLLIIVLILVILIIIFGIFFFNSVKRVENKVDDTSRKIDDSLVRFEKAAESVVDVADDVKATDAKVDSIIMKLESFEPQIIATAAQVENLVTVAECQFCKLFASDCTNGKPDPSKCTSS